MTLLSAREYVVGWICALSSELAAAKAMLDEEHEIIKDKDPTDSNSYALGRIHGHNVVLACLPAGIDGTDAAAIVATNMLRTFTGLKFGLMVGIGGGIPDLENGIDIRLGDVVVSQPTGTSGGVIQYDKGKSLGDGTFTTKGYLNSPPSILLTALHMIQADHEMRDAKALIYLEDLVRKYPRMVRSGYVFPGRDTDLLRCHYSDGGHQTCTRCEQGVLKRPGRENDDPAIHYGIIASGNKVIKNSVERTEIQKLTKAVCVEMEAAGLMNDFPCLVIRGICDYADSHKNDRWHKYAAAVAAAYAKEVLLYVSPERARQEQPVQQMMGMLLDQQKIAQDHLDVSYEYIQRSEERWQDEDVQRLRQEYRDCRLTFKTSNYEDFKNVNPERVQGTCRWVLDHHQYLQWSECQSDTLLWISADPGCGKSVLAKSLIDDELSTISNHTTCYFFFRDNEEQAQLSTALCAIIHQLFSRQPLLIRHAIDAWETSSHSLTSEVYQLWRIFLAAGTDPECHHVTCVIDALDECNEKDRRRLITLLTEFYTSVSQSATESARSSQLKFLVTSRPYDDIEFAFKDIPSELPTIRLHGEEKGDQIQQEIDMVIETKLETLMKDLRLDQQIGTDLKRQLLGMKNRTYLWLHLAIDSIYDTYRSSLRPNQESIELLPPTVEDAYEKILDQVKPKDEDTVRRIFAIVIGARRPLTVLEMATALGLATSSDLSSLDHVSLDPRLVADRIRVWCGLFVTIRKSKIYLIHQTAKMFLLATDYTGMASNGWKHCLDTCEVERCMTRICIEYLYFYDIARREQISGVFRHRRPYRHGHHDRRRIDHRRYSNERRNANTGSASADAVMLKDDFRENSHFFAYSTEYWLRHLELLRQMDLQSDRRLLSKIVELHDSTSPVFHEWFQFVYLGFIEHARNEEISKMRGFTALHTLVLTGCTDVLEWMLSQPRHPPVDVTDANGNTPLVLASCLAHFEITELLVSRGASTTTCGSGSLGTALYEASSAGASAIVHTLLERGAEVNKACGDYGSALCAACIHGHLDVVKELLQYGADVTLGTVGIIRVGAPLHAAILFGDQEIVRLLLSYGADVNRVETDRSITPLGGAIAEGHYVIVDLLIASGAELHAAFDVKSVEGYLHAVTALHVASFIGNVELMSLLLENGADVNQISPENGTSLHSAVQSRSKEVVLLLLENGADVNTAVEDEGTALIAASALPDDQFEIVQLLLDYGANIKARNAKRGNAIAAAIANKSERVLRLLLDHGARFDENHAGVGFSIYEASYWLEEIGISLDEVIYGRR